MKVLESESRIEWSNKRFQKEDQESNVEKSISGEVQEVHTRLPTKHHFENLYTHYPSKVSKYLRDPFNALLDPIDELSRWTSSVGIHNLQTRCLIPPHLDPTPVLQKKKQCLIPKRVTIHDPILRLQRGTYYNDFHYGNVIKLAPIKKTVSEEVVPFIHLREKSSSELSLLEVTNNETGLVNSSVPGWVVYIREGRLERSSKAYERLNQTIKKEEIESVASWVLEKVESLIYSYGIPLVAVKCESIVHYSKNFITFPLPQEILLDCIFNRSEVEAYLRKPGQKFKHPEKGRDYAAVVIQSTFRLYKNRVQRARNLLEYRSANIIKRYMKSYTMRQKFLVKHQQVLKKAVESFDRFQKEFLSSEQDFLSSNRYVVYICPPHIDDGKRLDIARTFPLYYNPNLRFILVTPGDVPSIRDQVAGMYDCVHATSPLDNHKLNVLIPKTSKFVPDYFPAGSGLYFCSYTMTLLKELTKKRDPIVIAEEMNPYIAYICDFLHCPFMGPTYDISLKIQHDPSIFHDWLEDFDVPVSNQLNVSITNEQDLIETVSVFIQQRQTCWRFRKREHGRLSYVHQYISKDTIRGLIESPKDFDWGDGGLLEQLNCQVDNYKIVEVGLQIEPSKKWKVIGSNEQRMYKGEQFGMLVPQCIVDSDNLFDLTVSVARALTDNSIFGYVTYQCIIWRETDGVAFVLSDFFPYLTLNILKSSSLAVKCRLAMDETSFKMTTRHEVPWKFPYLSKSEDVNLERIHQDFEKYKPSEINRVAFWFDKCQHDALQYMPHRLSAIHLIEHGLLFDDWVVEGVRFPYTESGLPIICVALSQEQAYEMMLACFVAIEAYMYYPGCDLNHNLYEMALPIMQELQIIRKKNHNSLGLLTVDPKQFVLKTKKLRELVSEVSFKTFLPPDYQDQVLKISEKEKQTFSTDTIKLLAEEIPSLAAFEEDHTLKNPIAIKRARKNSIVSKEQKAQLEKGEKLINKIEELFDEGDETTVKYVPWHKLLQVDAHAEKENKSAASFYRKRQSTVTKLKTSDTRNSVTSQPKTTSIME